MQAVIMTGGRGSRLRPLTDRIPKGLVKIKGRPFLELLILYLRNFGIDDILLCTGYLGNQIREYFKDGSELGVRIEYSQENTPLGTGGALRPALPKLDDEFFLVNGDTFLPINYDQMRERFGNSPALLMVAVFRGGEYDLRANLRINEKDEVVGAITGDKKNMQTHIDAGVRLVKKEIAGYFPSERVFSLENDIYPRLIKDKKISAWPVEERYYDIGTPERIKIFEEYLEELQ